METFWISLISVASVVAIVTLVVIYKILTTGMCKSRRRLEGKTVIVTGANTGIGKETARDVAARGARVIMACRDMKKADQARDEIVAATGNQDVVTRQLDLASFSSVRQFAKHILATEQRLDVLVNNAGLAGVGKVFTKDNILVGMQANHFGPFLLTVLLTDLLKKSAPSRIVTVSSVAHKFYKFDVDDMNGEKSFKDFKIYSYSKLANILMSNELARRLEGTGVTSNSLHPGAVETEFSRNMNPVLRFSMWPLAKIFCKNAVEGAQTTIYLAVSDEVEGVTGKYFADCKEQNPSAAARDATLARKLWEKSEEFVKLSPEEKRL